MTSVRVYRNHRRAGFSLIEMITAMIAATVLITALAASIVISTSLLESPPTEQDQLQERMLEDRLRSDLRYATSINDSIQDRFEIVRPNPTTGVSETIVYLADSDGFTRQVDAGPITQLDDQAPSSSWDIDEHTAPDQTTATSVVRVCATSRASTSSIESNLEIAVPTGLKSGDHVFLCVSAKTPDSVGVDHAGWQSMQSRSNSDLRLVVMHRAYDKTWPSSIQVSCSPASAMAVVLVAVENANTTAPIAWSSGGSGYSWSSSSSTHPTYAQNGATTSRQLNLQVYAADDDPWWEGLMGMAGFCDVIHETAARGLSEENSIGVLVRNGVAPSLSFTPRLLYLESGFWIRASAQVEAAP